MSSRCMWRLGVRFCQMECRTYLPGTPCSRYPRRNGMPVTQLAPAVGLDRHASDLSQHTCAQMPSAPSRVGHGSTYQSSEHRKSLQSARTMSFTPGSSTMELIGRFWRAPFQRQHPYVLDRNR